MRLCYPPRQREDTATIPANTLPWLGEWLTIGAWNGRSVVVSVTTSLTVVVRWVVGLVVVLRVVDLSVVVVVLEFSLTVTRWLISDAMGPAPEASSSGQQTPGTKRLWKQIDFRRFSSCNSSAGQAVKSRHLPSPPFGVLQRRTSGAGVTTGASVVTSTLFDALDSLASLDSLDSLDSATEVMIFDGLPASTSLMVKLNLLLFLIKEVSVSFPRLNKVDPMWRSSLWRSSAMGDTADGTSSVRTETPISIHQIRLFLTLNISIAVSATPKTPKALNQHQIPFNKFSEFVSSQLISKKMKK